MGSSEEGGGSRSRGSTGARESKRGEGTRGEEGTRGKGGYSSIALPCFVFNPYTCRPSSPHLKPNDPSLYVCEWGKGECMSTLSRYVCIFVGQGECIICTYHRLNIEVDLQSLFGLHVT
jgi:hypothetical protein